MIRSFLTFQAVMAVIALGAWAAIEEFGADLLGGGGDGSAGTAASAALLLLVALGWLIGTIVFLGMMRRVREAERRAPPAPPTGGA
jgi:hypothetical protein